MTNYCSACGRAFRQTHEDELHRSPVIVLAAEYELRRRETVHRLALGLRALGLPRRDHADWFAATIFEFDGAIFTPDGRRFAPHDTYIDDALGNKDDADDGSQRWISYFLKYADKPPRQRPHKRIIERLRMIDLALKIHAGRNSSGLSPVSASPSGHNGPYAAELPLEPQTGGAT